MSGQHAMEARRVPVARNRSSHQLAARKMSNKKKQREATEVGKKGHCSVRAVMWQARCQAAEGARHGWPFASVTASMCSASGVLHTFDDACLLPCRASSWLSPKASITDELGGPSLIALGF